jgi:predicted metal-binding protein
MKERAAMIAGQFVEALHCHGLDNFGVVPSSEFVFHKSFYDACATNQCGKFNSNWSCPPGVGCYEDLVARIQSFDQGLVVQSVWAISDSFDIEGMLKSEKQHSTMLRSLVDDLYPLLGSARKMTLSAGACSLCKECSYVERKPCPMPKRAFGALEAHGVDVAALLDRCGLKYNNGPNTVSYVGVVLFDSEPDRISN